MPRFFAESVAGERIVLTGEDARHIVRSLRMRPGEALTVCDGKGTDCHCILESVSPDEAVARVEDRCASETEPAVRIRLYQALPKGDKLDFIVQKAVELGVHEIVPVLTERCVSRPDPKSMDKKIGRLQRIALEAAKQAGRGVIPSVLPLLSYRDAISGMKDMACAILLYEQAQVPLSSLLAEKTDSLGLLVGSEGGFSPEEAEYAAAQGIPLASLGKRILRCETAPICALSAALFAYGEF